MSDFNEVKRLIEDQGRAWDEFKKANDSRLAALEQSKSTSDVDAKLAKIDAALDDVKARADEAVKRSQRPNFGGDADPVSVEAKSFADIGIRRGGAIDADGYAQYKQAFHSFVRARGNMDLLSAEHRKSMQAGIDVEGGYLLPPPAVAAIVAKVREMNTMRTLASSISISTNAIEGLVDRNDAAASWVTEMASRAETDSPNLDRDRIDTHEIYSFPGVSQQLLEDAAVDVESWLVEKVSIAFAEAENAAFFTGNGVGRPRGLTTYTTAATADSSRAWGTIQHVNTGANGAYHTTKADPLFDLVGALKAGYQQGAVFVMNRGALAATRKLKEATSDRYLWEPSLQAGVPSTLLGYPVMLDEQMPAHTVTGGLGIAFGNIGRAYLVVDRVGVSVLRDPYTMKPKVGLYVRKRVGGAVRDFDAVKFLRFSA
jgi:HK97 family phage major capsid protein